MGSATSHFIPVRHEDWIGLTVELTLERERIAGFDLRFVRHNGDNETIFRRPGDEPDTLADLTARSCKLGAVLAAQDDRVRVIL